MIKVYNKALRTFRLVSVNEKIKLIKPLTFATIEDEYEGDITFKTAMAAGDLVPYESMKQADAIEQEANEAEEEKPHRRVKKVE